MSHLTPNALSREELAQLFHFADVEESAYIDLQQFIGAMQSIQLIPEGPISDEVWTAISEAVKASDIHGRGFLDLAEFIHAYDHLRYYLANFSKDVDRDDETRIIAIRYGWGQPHAVILSCLRDPTTELPPVQAVFEQYQISPNHNEIAHLAALMKLDVPEVHSRESQFFKGVHAFASESPVQQNTSQNLQKPRPNLSQDYSNDPLSNDSPPDVPNVPLNPRVDRAHRSPDPDPITNNTRPATPPLPPQRSTYPAHPPFGRPLSGSEVFGRTPLTESPTALSSKDIFWWIDIQGKPSTRLLFALRIAFNLPLDILTNPFHRNNFGAYSNNLSLGKKEVPTTISLRMGKPPSSFDTLYDPIFRNSNASQRVGDVYDHDGESSFTYDFDLKSNLDATDTPLVLDNSDGVLRFRKATGRRNSTGFPPSRSSQINTRPKAEPQNNSDVHILRDSEENEPANEDRIHVPNEEVGALSQAPPGSSTDRPRISVAPGPSAAVPGKVVSSSIGDGKDGHIVTRSSIYRRVSFQNDEGHSDATEQFVSDNGKFAGRSPRLMQGSGPMVASNVSIASSHSKSYDPSIVKSMTPHRQQSHISEGSEGGPDKEAPSDTSNGRVLSREISMDEDDATKSGNRSYFHSPQLSTEDTYYPRDGHDVTNSVLYPRVNNLPPPLHIHRPHSPERHRGIHSPYRAFPPPAPSAFSSLEHKAQGLAIRPGFDPTLTSVEDLGNLLFVHGTLVSSWLCNVPYRRGASRGISSLSKWSSTIRHLLHRSYHPRGGVRIPLTVNEEYNMMQHNRSGALYLLSKKKKGYSGARSQLALVRRMLKRNGVQFPKHLGVSRHIFYPKVIANALKDMRRREYPDETGVEMSKSGMRTNPRFLHREKHIGELTKQPMFYIPNDKNGTGANSEGPGGFSLDVGSKFRGNSSQGDTHDDGYDAAEESSDDELDELQGQTLANVWCTPGCFARFCLHIGCMRRRSAKKASRHVLGPEDGVFNLVAKEKLYSSPPELVTTPLSYFCPFGNRVLVTIRPCAPPIEVYASQTKNTSSFDFFSPVENLSELSLYTSLDDLEKPLQSESTPPNSMNVFGTSVRDDETSIDHIRAVGSMWTHVSLFPQPPFPRFNSLYLPDPNRFQPLVSHSPHPGAANYMDIPTQKPSTGPSSRQQPNVTNFRTGTPSSINSTPIDDPRMSPPLNIKVDGAPEANPAWKSPGRYILRPAATAAFDPALFGGIQDLMIAGVRSQLKKLVVSGGMVGDGRVETLQLGSYVIITLLHKSLVSNMFPSLMTSIKTWAQVLQADFYSRPATAYNLHLRLLNQIVERVMAERENMDAIMSAISKESSKNLATSILRSFYWGQDIRRYNRNLADQFHGENSRGMGHFPSHIHPSRNSPAIDTRIITSLWTFLASDSGYSLSIPQLTVRRDAYTASDFPPDMEPFPADYPCPPQQSLQWNESRTKDRAGTESNPGAAAETIALTYALSHPGLVAVRHMRHRDREHGVALEQLWRLITSLQGQYTLQLQADSSRLFRVIVWLIISAIPVSFLTGYWSMNFKDLKEFDPDLPHNPNRVVGVKLFWFAICCWFALLFLVLWRGQFLHRN